MGKTKKEPKHDKLSNKFLDVGWYLQYKVKVKRELEDKAAAMQPEIEKIENKLVRVESQIYARIPGEFIITYVKGINKALQYYQYMPYLRSCDFLQNNEQVIFYQLVDEQEEVEESNKLSEELIQDCLDARILELRGARAWKNHQFVYGRYLKKHRVKNVESMIHAMYPDLKNVKAENAYLLLDPISTKVFKTIEKEYVMDPDPKVELLNILKSSPLFYQEHFIVGKSPIEESSVVEALEEYSHFHSKYVKAAIATEPAVERGEVDNSGMPDTILLGHLSMRMMTPFPVIDAPHIAKARGESGKKRKSKRRKCHNYQVWCTTHVT